MTLGTVIDAIRSDNIDEFQKLLETVYYPYGEIAEWTLYENKPHLLECMLKDQKYYSIDSLLQYALEREKIRLVKYCADRNLSGYSYNADPLYVAVRLGDYDLAQEIIDKRPNLAADSNSTVATLFVYAMKKMDFVLLKFLAKNSCLTHDNVCLAEELHGDNSWP